MTLFYVAAVDLDGENRDLFVNADDAWLAMKMADDYWANDKGERMEYQCPMKAFPVPIASTPGVVPWESIVTTVAD